MGRRRSWAFFQRRQRDDQQIHEKMFNINNHQGNANQTHNEISSHTCKKVCMCDQLCPTFYDPMDCSSPGSSVHGIFQARKLEWVAISSSRGSSWPRDRTSFSWVSHISRQILLSQSHLGSPKVMLRVMRVKGKNNFFLFFSLPLSRLSPSP